MLLDLDKSVYHELVSKSGAAMFSFFSYFWPKMKCQASVLMFECQGNRSIYQMQRKRELFPPKMWCLNKCEKSSNILTINGKQ